MKCNSNLQFSSNAWQGTVAAQAYKTGFGPKILYRSCFQPQVCPASVSSLKRYLSISINKSTRIVGMWRASENPWTSFNMIQQKPPFVCLLIPGTLNKKAPLLRCSCRIGWNKWSPLTMSSISTAFWVMTCSVSKGGYTTNLPPKYSFKSPITKRSCDNDHPFKNVRPRQKTQDSHADC